MRDRLCCKCLRFRYAPLNTTLRLHCITGYWLPSEIYYCRPQMLWLLPMLPDLRRNWWPAGAEETGGGSNIRTCANFEKISVVVSDIEIRLRRVQRDSELDARLLLTLYSWQSKSASELGWIHGLEEGEVNRRAWRALNYISGYKAKVQTYEEFCARPRMDTLLTGVV